MHVSDTIFLDAGLIYGTTQAYISLSLDCTGLLRYMAFWVALKGGTSGRKLYLFFFLFFFFFGVIVGNVSPLDPSHRGAMLMQTNAYRTPSSSPGPPSSPTFPVSPVSPHPARGSLCSSHRATSPRPSSSPRTPQTWSSRGHTTCPSWYTRRGRYYPSWLPAWSSSPSSSGESLGGKTSSRESWRRRM